MRWKPDGIWLNANYRILWSAVTVSSFGSKITDLAIPLLAAIALHASPFEIAVLAAAQNLATPVFGLFAGVVADHRARRPLLIVSDAARAVLLIAIPIAWWLDELSVPLLIVVSFISGSFRILFDVARQSIVPNLVTREQLVDGNGKLYTSEAAADLTGPGLAGILVQLIGAPAAVLLDCVSYAVSALFLARMTVVERIDRRPLGIRNVLSGLPDGARVLREQHMLRWIGLSVAVGNLFESASAAMLVLFMTRRLDLSAAEIGIIFACGGLGFFVGSIVATRFAARLGLGRAINAGLLIFLLGDLLYPVAGGPPLMIVALLSLAQFLGGIGGGVFDINQFSLRQVLIPDEVRGRVNALLRVMIRGIMPVGALLGGVIAETVDLRAVFVFACLSSPISIWFMYRAGVPRLNSMNEAPVPQTLSA